MKIALYMIFAALSCVVALYIFMFIRRSIRSFGVSFDKKIKYIVFAVSVALSLWVCLFFGISAIMLIHIMFISIIMRGINFIVKKIAGNNYVNMKKWKFSYESGIVPVVFASLIMIYGYINMNNVVETGYTVYTDKAIRDEGYRVLMVADVHYGVSLDYDGLEEVCNLMEGKKPDIVVLCGDIIDEGTDKKGMEEVFSLFGNIDSEYGTYYVYGNHDR